MLGLVICGISALALSRYLAIPKLQPLPPGESTPDCMVVIPARDEQDFIARAVSSLPHDTVIVVDDQSSDRTAEAARKAGAGVLPAPDLPRGAIGKANACLAGARLLNSNWILFADADLCFAPGFLESAIASAEAGKVAFLSILPRAELVRWSETILFPYAQMLFFSAVAPRRDPAAAFNGQCLLARRDAYEFLGGHAAVMNSLVDDLKIAALARRHRLAFGIARAEMLAHARFREPRAAFRRAACRFMLVNFAIGAMLLLTASIWALWLPVLLWLIVIRESAAAWIFGFAPMLAMLAWYRNVWRAIQAPLAIYLMLPIVYRSAAAALLGRPVEWKGRTI
ncbi:MAG TPA: glycosyltransferase family 2 protein [Bryobacteraceae bacterium]|nr:glycosyltransferase family 2 protein [Bryobacteraceae bacterium]